MQSNKFYNLKKDLKNCLTMINDKKIDNKYDVEQTKSVFKHFLNFCQENEIITSYDKSHMYNIIENSLEENDN